ncbi:MAG: putative alpha/beta hydrolase [Saprospiraceae bacterium]|jgi:predicted alpha/beta hydrolase
MVNQKEYKIKNRNAQEIALLEIKPQSSKIKAIIQFHSGTVIKKEFYLKYAQFLADVGYVVILFDYRGVGESRSQSLKNSIASISSWRIADAPAVTDWIIKKYPNFRLLLLAHSMGDKF